MFEVRPIDILDKPEFYRELARQLESLLESERDYVANAANTSSLLFHALPDVNWVGFYFLREGDELVVGPFQGKPACVRIAKGHGVCGAAVDGRRTVLVPDVHEFPGHVVCDPDSRSEIVVPLLSGSRVIGVLDLDSPHTSRFDSNDQTGLEHLAAIYLSACEWAADLSGSQNPV